MIEAKLVHVDLRNEHSEVRMNNTVVPCHNSAQDLGIKINARLKWNEHIKKKYWLLRRKSNLSIFNK